MDIMMPKMDGIEAIRQIKPFCPNTKIVMCTSIEQKKVIEEALAADASDFVIKPFDSNSIRAVVEKYLGKRKTNVLEVSGAQPAFI